MEDRKTIFKAADRVLYALSQLRQKRYLAALERLRKFIEQNGELGKESRKLGLSLNRSWDSAAGSCCERICRLLNDISYATHTVKQVAGQPRKAIPKLSVIVAELSSLEDEFGSIKFDGDANTISVITEPITLDYISFGPFEIRLHIDKLSELYRDSPYYCIALDPNPAATDSGVTHPHVSNDKVCEGDGYDAIRAALEQGRLGDFFSLVRGILNTYNPDSPYVSLEEWDGIACYDCGYVSDRENMYFCPFCDHDICDECNTYCRGCDESICRGCAVECEICEEPFCQGCLGSCDKCGCVCCQGCMEDGLCLNCKEEQEQENKENENKQENQKQPDNKGQIKEQIETIQREQVTLTG